MNQSVHSVCEALRMSEREFLVRAREAAIWSLSRSPTMNRAASETWRVAYRLGQRDFDDTHVGAIRRFWSDLARPLDEVLPPEDGNLQLAREMAASEALESWQDDVTRGRMEADAYRSGLRDDYPAVKYRLEGLRVCDSDGNPEGGDGEAAPSRSDDSAARRDRPETGL